MSFLESAITKKSNDVLEIVETINTLQDRIVKRYFLPYSVTLVYWSFAFVFFYLGLQKVVPHRSTADVQLATIGGLLGVPYIPFVTAIGIWQIAIGLLFLLRRLRLCAWLFFSYQFFTFGTLIVLKRIVFQPPWITIMGIEIPWALGSYSAFILKNLIFAAIFFLLATYEIGEDDGSEGLITALYRQFVSTPIRKLLTVVPRNRILSRVAAIRINAWQDFLVNNYFKPYAVPILYLSYGFIFFYFGFQKPAPVLSPVRTPLSDFFPHFGIPLNLGMLFIGFYEMTLGILFFLREIRVAFWLFLPHQTITFLSLLIIPFVAFQPPWITILDVQIPWALTGYGAFVIKNIVFVAGFILLVGHELGPHSNSDRD